MAKAKKTINAEICLYGNREIGFSFLALARGDARPFGPYKPDQAFDFDDCTSAVWSASQTFRDRGVTGSVRIFAPGGHRYADAELASVPSYGSLAWESIPGL